MLPWDVDTTETYRRRSKAFSTDTFSAVITYSGQEGGVPKLFITDKKCQMQILIRHCSVDCDVLKNAIEFFLDVVDQHLQVSR